MAIGIGKTYKAFAPGNDYVHGHVYKVLEHVERIPGFHAVQGDAFKCVDVNDKSERFFSSDSIDSILTEEITS